MKHRLCCTKFQTHRHGVSFESFIYIVGPFVVFNVKYLQSIHWSLEIYLFVQVQQDSKLSTPENKILPLKRAEKRYCVDTFVFI